MKEINELIREYKPNGYIKKGNIIIINTNKEKIIVKEKTDIYDYLKSRNFMYYPKIINSNDKYQAIEYINGIDMPDEQKIIDIIDIIGMLHNKTTYYSNTNKYENIYEDIINNIEHLTNYYVDLITIIESKVYPSPSELVLENNISKIFACLNYSKEKINEWLKIMEVKQKQRYVLLHNNLDLNHYIRKEEPYLISWNKAKIDIPIFDLYKLYRKYALKFDFYSILKRYEKIYPLLKEERQLLFILISLPNKIELNKTEYENTKEVTNLIETINKTDKL